MYRVTSNSSSPVQAYSAEATTPSMSILFPIHSLINILSFVSITRSVIVNVTVDDIFPDPLTGVRITYLPETGWNEGPTCTTCKAAPDG
ncbi:hypothetical protein BDQ17DRAFT_649015 [Cyathus striatus]|nr:hypothetical protein BDQ17DRAFT_649015 [Cyathus striatus]